MSVRPLDLLCFAILSGFWGGLPVFLDYCLGVDHSYISLITKTKRKTPELSDKQ